MLKDSQVAMPDSVRADLNGALRATLESARSFDLSILAFRIGSSLLVVGALFLAWLKTRLAGPPLAAAVVVAGLLVLLFWLWNHRKDDGDDREEVALALRRCLEAGIATHRSLTILTEQAWIEHEHGVMVFVGVGDGRTLFLDLSEVADDPRYPMYEDKSIFRQEWTWFEVAGSPLGTLEFAVSGKSFVPVLLGHDSNAASEVFEQIGSPGDGEVVERSWQEVFASLTGKCDQQRR
jgi:hypothetical protein